MPSNTKKSVSASKPKTFQAVKGMRDILPAEYPYIEKVYKTAKDLLEFYNFLPITVPIVEQIDLYVRTTGETSDIVEKQMFSIKSRSSDVLALRPEFTPGIGRAYLEHGMSHWPQPVKLSSIGPVFRGEQPQAGRLRQFNQIDFEILSPENDPIYDAQVIIATYRILDDLKIKDLVIQINTIGCRTCRPNFRKALVSYYKSHEKQLCSDCKRRLLINPLRLLDCKEKDCQPLKENAPITLDYLCSNCKHHFKGVLEYLEDLKLPYRLTNTLVRGLDYYTKTVFEIFTEGDPDLDFALAGGGRYDYLIEALGGKATPAIGVAMGIERIIQVLQKRGLVNTNRQKEKIFLIHIGDLAKKKSLSLIETLRNSHISVIESLGKESMDAQMRVANKLQSPLALIFGQKEAYEESIIIRDMKTGAQEIVPLAKVAEMIKKKLAQ